jgi:DNA-binding response OmpR family regulator
LSERLGSHARQGTRILLVEDSDDVRTLMTLMLESEGYAVDSTDTAEEGLRLLDGQDYALVVSDYALPGRTGAWMLREATARHLLSQGVIVTAHPSPRDTDNFPVIYKPLDFDDFLQRIRLYLERGAFPATLPTAPSRSLDGHASGARS